VAIAGFTFEHVSVVAGEVTILDDVDVALGGSVLTVVAGPSGAGKSTLLRLCNRLDVPSSGRVLLDGDDLAGLDPLALRRRAGMVFQRPVTFPGTVAENLAVADPTGAHDPAEAIARVGLDPALLERRADDLSGGEAQRMCIARTLLTEPDVLLLDEPTSALDVDARVHVEDLLVDLVHGGLRALWVTHDLDQAERLVRRCSGTIVVIMGGRVAPDDVARRSIAARSFTAGSRGGAGGAGGSDAQEAEHGSEHGGSEP